MSKSVKRTLDVFELFAEHKRPLSLSEISKLLKIPVSSCADVLQALQERGFIYELGRRAGFYPTVLLQRLGDQIVANDPVILRAETQLRALRDEFDESVLLARISGAEATYLLVFEPSQPLLFRARVGVNVRRLHATASGKAVLGSLDEAGREEVYRSLKLEAFTDRTITSLDTLRKEIDESLARGWFANREESVPTTSAVSAMFTWHRSSFVIAVAGPTFRMEPKLDEVIRRLKETCRALEESRGQA